MRSIAIKQALFFPLGVMLTIMLVGFTVPGYSSMSQQMSELGLLGGYPSVFLHILAFVVGASIIIFSFALIRHPSGRFAFTVFTSTLFGISMLFNGIFPMGNPLHGLYGIGFFTVLTPTLFAMELNPDERAKAISAVSKWVVVVILFYFWLTITRLDPSGFQGLTQRLAIIPMFGWYAYASHVLLRKATKSETAMNSAHS